CGHDEIFFAVQLNAPGDAARRKQLRTGRRRHAPDMQIRITVMRRHLPTAAPGVALCKIFETELARRYSAPEHKTAVAIIRHDMVVCFHLNRDRCERLVAHSGNMKMSLALTIQILFTQVRMAALKDRC